MSRETEMAEEKKMLEFLNAKGIKTLEQLKDIFRHHDEKDDDDVEFVKETKACINDAKLIMLLEASKRNKQILMNKLSITAVTSNTAGTSTIAVTKIAATTTSQLNILAQQTATVPVVGHIVENARDTTKNATSLPMRYRHKHTHQYHPYQQEIRRQQQRQIRPQLRQAYEVNAHQQNIQYNQYQNQQHNYYVHNQNRYQGVGQNMTGYNNGCVYTTASWQSGGVGINSTGQTIPVSQPLASTTVYNTVLHQQWPAATMTAHTGDYGYNNYCQFHTTPQASQQPASQYISQGSRPIYNQN